MVVEGELLDVLATVGVPQIPSLYTCTSGKKLAQKQIGMGDLC